MKPRLDPRIPQLYLVDILTTLVAAMIAGMMIYCFAWHGFH